MLTLDTKPFKPFVRHFCQQEFNDVLLFVGRRANIFDNMLAIMEKYAGNLEALVAERTEQLLEEKKKTDALLFRMLPR